MMTCMHPYSSSQAPISPVKFWSEGCSCAQCPSALTLWRAQVSTGYTLPPRSNLHFKFLTFRHSGAPNVRNFKCRSTLNDFKCNHLMLLHFKGLTYPVVNRLTLSLYTGKFEAFYQLVLREPSVALLASRPWPCIVSGLGWWPWHWHCWPR